MQEPFSPHIEPDFAQVNLGNAEIASKESSGTIHGGRTMPGQVKIKGRSDPVRGWIRIKRDSNGKWRAFFKPFAGQEGVETKEVALSDVSGAMELQFNSAALANRTEADRNAQTPLEQALYPDAKRYSVPLSNTEKQANAAMNRKGADDYLGDPPKYDWAQTGLQNGGDGGGGGGEGQDVFISYSGYEVFSGVRRAMKTRGAGEDAYDWYAVHLRSGEQKYEAGDGTVSGGFTDTDVWAYFYLPTCYGDLIVSLD